MAGVGVGVGVGGGGVGVGGVVGGGVGVGAGGGVTGVAPLRARNGKGRPAGGGVTLESNTRINPIPGIKGLAPVKIKINHPWPAALPSLFANQPNGI